MEKVKQAIKNLKLDIGSDFRIVGTGGLILSLLSLSSLKIDNDFYTLITLSFAMTIVGHALKINEALK